MSSLLVRGVVLDLDDTLLPERAYVASGYAHVAGSLERRIGVPRELLERQLWGIFDSQHRAQAYNRLLELHGIDDDALVVACIREYREHVPNVTLSPGTQEVLSWCLAHGPVGVVTDGPEAMQAAKAKALGLAEMGVQVVLTDTLGGREAWKPSPVGMREACQLMGVNPIDTVYVGDNPYKDFLAAHAAGMHAIRYRAPGQLHAGVEPGKGAEADIEISDLADLRTVLSFH